MKPIFIELPVRYLTEEASEKEKQGFLSDEERESDDCIEVCKEMVNICLIERISSNKKRNDMCYIHINDEGIGINLPKSEVEQLIQLECLLK